LRREIVQARREGGLNVAEGAFQVVSSSHLDLLVPRIKSKLSKVKFVLQLTC